MNAPVNSLYPLHNEADVLLSIAAVNVQLPASYHAQAGQRYQTLAAWLERDASPLRGRVARVYAQGAMSYGAVIANKATNDEYDVDAMVELDAPAHADPKWVLDTLFESVRGEKGSLYYDMTVRHTRCVQVRYADRMHVDLTPAVLRGGRPDRESVIFHHRAETPAAPGEHVIANPYAFGEWFRAQTPPDLGLFIGATDDYRLVEKARAETEPLPDQKHPVEMSRGLVSLQLIKRFRNLRYNDRDVRCPPSILLAYQIAAHGPGDLGLSQALLAYAVRLRDLVASAVTQGRLMHAANPRCAEDVLTDRWPADQCDQRLWLKDLEHLVRQLTLYVRGEPTLEQRRDILADLFGESVAGRTLLEFAQRMGRDKATGASRYRPGVGSLVLPAAPGLITRGRPEPRTDFFGGARPWRRR